jgi:hypothetical protein
MQPTIVTDTIFDEWLATFFHDGKVELPAQVKVPFGTDEWCNETYNTHEGCLNGCFYCYNWTAAWIKRKQWKRPVYTYYGKEIHLKPKWFKTWQDRPNRYVIMYPSTHDVFPDTMHDAFKIMKSMLLAKNITVLWVTKPRWEVVDTFIKTFQNYKDRIFPRLTITTNNQEELNFWEPHASSYEERWLCLDSLKKAGFQPSVSTEPMLTPKPQSGDIIKDELEFLNELLPLVSELWLGIMNHIPNSLVFRGQPITVEQAGKISAVRKFYSQKNIFQLVKMLYTNPQIRWKESIKKRMLSIMRKKR